MEHIAYKITDYADIYREIAEEISSETAIAIHRLSGGQNVRKLSKTFEYSERQIRRILAENKL